MPHVSANCTPFSQGPAISHLWPRQGNVAQQDNGILSFFAFTCKWNYSGALKEGCQISDIRLLAISFTKDIAPSDRGFHFANVTPFPDRR